MEGKIYWISGHMKPTRGNSIIQSSEISGVLIENNEIRFTVEGSDHFDSGPVQLLNTSGASYKGKIQSTSDHESVVEGVLYEDQQGYMLQGSWVDSSEYFTWMATIHKPDETK